MFHLSSEQVQSLTTSGDSVLFQCSKCVPTSAPLYLLCRIPGTHCPNMLLTCSLIAFSSLLKVHFIPKDSAQHTSSHSPYPSYPIWCLFLALILLWHTMYWICSTCLFPVSALWNVSSTRTETYFVHLCSIPSAWTIIGARPLRASLEMLNDYKMNKWMNEWWNFYSYEQPWWEACTGSRDPLTLMGKPANGNGCKPLS